jgi:Trk K+ transport system NAD-binding subunit
VTAIADLVTLPNLFDWRETTGQVGGIARETVVSVAIDGTRIAEVDVPADCVIVLVQRDGEYVIPDGDVVLRQGDDVTLLGRADAVDTAAACLAGEE